MKSFLFFLLLFISSLSIAQNNYIVKTDDGRRVLLKADYTWEYIDAEVPGNNLPIASASKPVKHTNCDLSENYEEPKLNGKIQAQLKRGRATIKHVKKKDAKDNDCDVKNVMLLSVSEQKAKATYTFCANGKKVSYKRVGTTIIKKQKLF